MTDVTISLWVDKRMHQEMKLHDEINWSAVLRNSIKEQLEHGDRIDTERATHAVKIIDNIRKSGVFAHGKPAVELVRKWRDRRR